MRCVLNFQIFNRFSKPANQKARHAVRVFNTNPVWGALRLQTSGGCEVGSGEVKSSPVWKDVLSRGLDILFLQVIY